MKVKANKYTEYIKINNNYFCYSYHLGSMVVITEPQIVQSIDYLLNSDYIDIDATNSIWVKLINDNIVLDYEVNPELMAEYTFQNFFICKDTLQLTVIVTRNCNFACPYCPQEHVTKNMNQKIWDNLLLFVKNTACKKRYSKLVISWFGGEPMLMYNQIVEFCARANNIAVETGLKIIYGMTTNGYLLSPEKAQKLFELNVLNYQITLDGTELFHDRLRVLQNGEGTWNTIWNNLNSFQKTSYKFDIGIRINCSPDMIEDAFQLINMISENLDNRYSVIPYSRNDMGGSSNSNIKYCNKFEAEVIKFELFNHALSKDVQCPHSFKYMKPFSRICTSNDPNFFILDYDGTLKKCEAVLDFPKNIVGYLSEEGKLIINHEINALWTIKQNKVECMECVKYPLCYGFDCREKLLNRNIYDFECQDDFGLEREYIKKYCLNFLEKSKK